MGNRKNKHLNIFYHYSQAAADPIENNISRGLAIILDSNPFILDRLFDLVNNKISSPVSSTVLANLAMLQKIEKPQREYEVNIQMNTTQIEPEYSNILGITLTEAILPIPIMNPSNNYGTITDITIEYDDTLIIIEVKPSDHNCMGQLINQMEGYISNYYKNNSSVVNGNIVSVSWTEIVELIETYQILHSSDNKIINDYYHLLRNIHPDWIPSKPLKLCQNEETELISKRVGIIMSDLVKKLNGINNGINYSLTNNNTMMCNLSWIDRIVVWYEYDEVNKEGKLTINFWPGFTKPQAYSLIQKTTDFKFVSKSPLSFSTALNNEVVNMKMVTKPYLCLKSMGSSVLDAYFNTSEIKSFNKHKYQNLMNMTGRKHSINNQWTNIYTPDITSKLENVNQFDNEFQDKFVNSKRTQYDLIFPFKVQASIPMDILKKIDVSSNSYTDVAVVLKELINQMIKEIES